MSKSFQSLFTYAAPIVEDGQAFFMEHSDGAISCAVKWAGIDYEATADEAALATQMKALYSFYTAASQFGDLFIENHLFRALDPYPAKQYLDYGQQNFMSDRNPEFAYRIRSEYADHLAGYSRHNDVYSVFLLRPKFGLLSGGISALEKRKKDLTVIVNDLIGFLPDARVLNADEYNSLILRHNQPNRVQNGRDKVPFNYRFDATNQLVKPVIDGVCIRTQGKNDSYGYYHRVIALLDYPNARQGWSNMLSRSNADGLHVVQITNALNTQLVNLASSRESERAMQSASVVGGEDMAGKVGDSSAFRNFVQEHNLTIHANTYIIVISDVSAEAVNQRHTNIRNWLNSSNDAVLITDDVEVELNFWRIAHPAQGYLAPYLRPDHHWQIANMTPCFAQSHGNMEYPEMAFLSSVSTVIGIRQRRGALHHSLEAAKTGSGKSMKVGAMVAQLYPLGFNFYITEVGRSYEWLVRAFGGEYHVLDAEKSVVSPFSSYEEMARIAPEEIEEGGENEEENRFSVTAISTMRNCLLPIMLGTSDIDDYPELVHYHALTDGVIRALYSEPDSSLSGPTLKTFLEKGREVLDYLDEVDSHLSPKLRIMLNNLDSFLSTSEGSVFKKADTLKFTSGLIGIDFGALIQGQATNLAKYLLLFTATRLQQLSFINPEQTFLMFDEDHEYTAIDKKLMNTLKSQVTKRGRKHGAFLYPISQVVEDIAYQDNGEVNKGVINQMSNFWLLYYGTDIAALPEVFKLAPRAEAIWRNYPDPLAPNNEFNYRQGLFVQSGTFYDFHLTWPKVLMAVMNSDPDAIIFKDQLLKEEKGDMVRIVDRFINEYDEWRLGRK